MTNNAPDYTENLAFPPQVDWADTKPKNNTDRTASTIELVEKIEKLSKQLEIAVKCLKNYKSGTTDKWFAEVALEQIKELDK